MEISDVVIGKNQNAFLESRMDHINQALEDLNYIYNLKKDPRNKSHIPKFNEAISEGEDYLKFVYSESLKFEEINRTNYLFEKYVDFDEGSKNNFSDIIKKTWERIDSNLDKLFELYEDRKEIMRVGLSDPDFYMKKVVNFNRAEDLEMDVRFSFEEIDYINKNLSEFLGE